MTNPLVKRLKLKRSTYEAMLNHVKHSIPKEACAILLGKIVEEFGFPSMEVIKMAKMPLKKDPRSA